MLKFCQMSNGGHMVHLFRIIIYQISHVLALFSYELIFRHRFHFESCVSFNKSRRADTKKVTAFMHCLFIFLRHENIIKWIHDVRTYSIYMLPTLSQLSRFYNTDIMYFRHPKLNLSENYQSDANFLKAGFEKHRIHCNMTGY